MKRKQYVKIKKASRPRYWYTDKIGEVFEVAWGDSSDYAIYNGSIGSCLVVKEDAELIVTEKRPAKKGEKVLVTDTLELGTTILSYEEAEVVSNFSNNPLEGDFSGVFVKLAQRPQPEYLSDDQYEVIVNDTSEKEEDTKVSRYEKVLEEALENLRKAVIDVRNAAYTKGFIDGRNEDRIVKPEKTAQERRDEIVEQAKADIENLKRRSPNGKLSYIRGNLLCNVEFVINKKKRTIVALLRSISFGTICGKGIAKAAPDDCFNVHIGKAIALHRALGIEVPDEYLNAPQPTEVRVGDVVRYVPTTGHVKEFTVGKIADGKAYDSDHPGLFAYLDAQNRYSLPCINPKTIDDSRTEVGE